MAATGSISQLANYLVDGFWTSVGERSHHWGTSTISYNVSGLTAAEAALAESALGAWREVANLNFVRVTGAANITFTHSGTMQAYTSDSYTSGGIITSATINVSSDWVARYSAARDSYSYQTYLHEIGHALGLGHQGPYNGSATYGTHNVFTNDTWQYSVMSYFAQGNYGGASSRYVMTPEMADIHAIQQIYGAANTRSGDTVYGFNSTAGATYNFANYSSAPALTIYDSSGNDWLDASGYSQNQIIDLRSGEFSSIGGLRFNVAISTTTIVENAIGGSGNDGIIGNERANILVGGRGNDTLTGMNAPFTWGADGSAIRIADFSGDGRTDVIQIERSGLIQGVASTGTGFGGVTSWGGGARPNDRTGDFNGDGRTDIVELNGSGTIYVWTSTGMTFTSYASWGWGARPSDLLADVNGDGRTDVIEPHENGTIYVWTSTGTGFNNYAVWGRGARPSDVLADVNGDGRSDLVELHENGNAYVWTSTGSSFSNYTVWGSGFTPRYDRLTDVSGDGRADVLEIDGLGRIYVWTANVSGTCFNSFQQWGSGARTSDQIGDFNGDGRSDIVELHDNGTAYVWLSTGSSFSNYRVWANGITPSYRIGDFNGDGRMDLIGLNGDGTADVRLSNGSSFDANQVWGTSLGNDTFVFRSSFGRDIVTDFDPQSADIIQFDPSVFADFNSVLSHAANDGSGNTVITCDANNVLTLLGVTVAELTAQEFVFA